MKTNLLKATAFALVMTPLYNCSVEPIDSSEEQLTNNQIIVNQSMMDPVTCDGQIPRARLINNGTIPFDFKIIDSNGVILESEDNVVPGLTSDWKSFPNGQLLFVISNVNFFGEKVAHTMDFCTEINLEINADNLFTDATPQEASN